MMAGRLSEKARAVFDATAFRVASAEIQAPQPGERDRLGAHGARLEGHINVAAGQAFTAGLTGGGADHQHLGVGCRIIQLAGAVAVGGEDQPVADNRRADGYFAARRGQMGLGKRPVHGGGAARRFHGRTMEGGGRGGQGRSVARVSRPP